jgi:putative NIF3 family GTP cyclohydrolase 1 type 2
MNKEGMSRREMLAAGTALAMSGMSRAEAAEGLTANDIVARIKAHVGVPWREKTVDGIVAGDPATPVHGVAVTMMATLAALKAAVAAGRNFVVSHEPTFWSHQEEVDPIRNDPLYLYKRAFIKDHDLVVFHFHDHWHALKPRDGIAVGMMRKLGWEGFADAANPQRFAFPEAKTLGALAGELSARLEARTLRVIGDPDLKVKNALASWGYVMRLAAVEMFNLPDVDAVIAGETWEWEAMEYAQDLVAAGRKKALVIVGHVESEQWGMQYCAEWLKGFVPEVPVEFLPIVEPYWNPTLRDLPVRR